MKLTISNIPEVNKIPSAHAIQYVYGCVFCKTQDEINLVSVWDADIVERVFNEFVLLFFKNKDDLFKLFSDKKLMTEFVNAIYKRTFSKNNKFFNTLKERFIDYLFAHNSFLRIDQINPETNISISYPTADDYRRRVGNFEIKNLLDGLNYCNLVSLKEIITKKEIIIEYSYQIGSQVFKSKKEVFNHVLMLMNNADSILNAEDLISFSE